MNFSYSSKSSAESGTWTQMDIKDAKNDNILYGSSQLCSYSNHSQDTGCTIMDAFITKANDVCPTQTQIENLTLQPNGLNAHRVRATNNRCACATREDQNPDRTRNSQQHVIYT